LATAYRFSVARSGPATGVTDYVYRNAARAVTAGADVGARYEPTGALSFEANYAYLWTRDLDAREPLPNRPAHTLTLAALVDWGKLDVALRYRAVSRAFVDRLDDGSAERGPCFGLLDARVAYRFVPAIAAFVGALNVLNERRNPLNAIARPPGRSATLLGAQRGVAGRLMGLRLAVGVRMIRSRESSMALQPGWNCQGNRRPTLGIVET
jgi:outer membrane receptor protein involved in Fe transport